ERRFCPITRTRPFVAQVYGDRGLWPGSYGIEYCERDLSPAYAGEARGCPPQIPTARGRPVDRRQAFTVGHGSTRKNFLCNTDGPGTRLVPKPFQNPKKWQACFQPLSSRFPARKTDV